jgi:hypothetical protein
MFATGILRPVFPRRGSLEQLGINSGHTGQARSAYGVGCEAAIRSARKALFGAILVQLIRKTTFFEFKQRSAAWICPLNNGESRGKNVVV